MKEDKRKKLRDSCIQDNIPIISIDTEIFLRNYIIQYQPNSIIEIGSAV